MLRVANILLPVDPTGPNPALAQALFWARQYRATLHAVHIRTIKADAHYAIMSRCEPSDEVRRCVDAYARRTSSTSDGFPLRAVTVDAPSRAEGLLRYASEHAIDLIVAAPPSNGLSTPALHDPTLANLLQRASCPVLIAAPSPAPHSPYQHLLAPIECSHHAQRGLGYAKSIAALYGATLDVLHVLERPRYLALSTTDMLSLSDARLPERKALRRMQSLFENAPGPAVEARFHVAHGNPTREIAAFAAAHDNDLIVLSSHGSTGRSQPALGTVTTKTLRDLALPIFLVSSSDPLLVAPTPAVSGSESTAAEE